MPSAPSAEITAASPTTQLSFTLTTPSIIGTYVQQISDHQINVPVTGSELVTKSATAANTLPSAESPGLETNTGPSSTNGAGVGANAGGANSNVGGANPGAGSPASNAVGGAGQGQSTATAPTKAATSPVVAAGGSLLSKPGFASMAALMAAVVVLV